MVVEVFAEDQDVVEIYSTEDVKDILKSLIDVTLKGRGSIIETERHHLILKLPEPRTESRHLFALFLHTDIIEYSNDIQLDIISSFIEFTQHILDPWYGVSVLNSHRIESTVVHVKAESSSRLSNKDD